MAAQIADAVGRGSIDFPWMAKPHRHRTDGDSSPTKHLMLGFALSEGLVAGRTESLVQATERMERLLSST